MPRLFGRDTPPPTKPDPWATPAHQPHRVGAVRTTDRLPAPAGPESEPDFEEAVAELVEEPALVPGDGQIAFSPPEPAPPPHGSRPTESVAELLNVEIDVPAARSGAEGNGHGGQGSAANRRRRPLRARRPDEPGPPEPTGTAAPPRPVQATYNRLLGDLLVAEGLVTQGQLDQALATQARSGGRVGELLIRMGALDDQQLAHMLGEQFGIGQFDLALHAPDPQVASRLNEAVAREYMALPLREVDGVLDVVVGDPKPGMEARLQEAIGGPIQLYIVPSTAARQAIDRAYRALADVDRMVKAFTATTDTSRSVTAREEAAVAADSPVAKVVTMLVTEALRDRASDVHLEPSDQMMRVRYRIDGALHDVLSLPMTMAAPLISRVKILANMNIVERRKAQDGQFATEVDGRGIDVRVSTMATVFGEKCVMRILDKSRSLYKLGELGMPPDTQVEYDKMVRSPFGMVICAGPTGSGKTTTLYATLNEIDERARNVVTIEDPVEYVFPTINQIQTNDQAGITFAEGLRAILRQDPDVILVGEVRDTETARIATQAALTGHFVLSSLHATDSVAALHRFLDMGIEAFLVASSVLGIVSQRLVRRVCQGCVAPYQPTPEELAFYEEAGGPPKQSFIQGMGCSLCADTGYLDRIGVYEFLRMTPEIRRLLVGWATQDELRRVAINQGMRTLRTEGISLVEQDVTTISEVIRSIYAL
jgi:type IV pilus assembly protein PilB